MESEDARLALELQILDIEDFLSTRKGKGKEDEIVDNEEAFKVQALELRARLTALQDQAMCKSISKAVQDDAVELVILRQEENQALRDRAQAFNVEGGTAFPNPNHLEQDPTLDTLSEDFIESLMQWNVFEPSEVVKKDTDATEAEQCAACMTTYEADEMIIAPCKHQYCNACLCQLFEESLRDESLFPPRCCRQKIPLSQVRFIIGAKATNKVELKAIEMATTDRTYCSDPNCAAFILPSQVRGNEAFCLKCPTVTCSLCKRPLHGEENCAASLEHEVLAAAAQAGWQRCYQCRSLVELHTGCNHIT